MNETEWEEAVDDLKFYNDWVDDQIVEQHYQEEREADNLEDLFEELDLYSEWVDELEELVNEKSSEAAWLKERQEFYEEWVDELVGILASKNTEIAELKVELEHQKKVILSLRNKNSQLIGDINELLDGQEN